MITYAIYEDVFDRVTNERIESTMICDCPDYTRSQRVISSLDETIYSKGAGGNFYIEYRVVIIEHSPLPWD